MKPRRLLVAVVLLALFSAPMHGATVTLADASATIGPSAVVHSTAPGASGGTDRWTFVLIPSGAAWERRVRLEQSLDGVHWATVALFLGPDFQIVKGECGPCYWRAFVAGNPNGTALTITATASGSLTPEVVAP